MKVKYLLIIAFFTLVSVANAQDYKHMMEDPSYNVYDVVKAAEKYFSTIDRYAKGSGWMGYQRWLNKVEPYYYPSGNRMVDDPRKVDKSYNNFKKKYPPAKLRSDDQGWIDLGPYYAGNISTHYSPGLGRIEHVWVEPVNKQIMYLASRSGGFWRSIDGGQNWENTTDNLTSSGVDVFDVNPNNINDILINVRNARNGVTMGIYRSLDGGLTWNTTVFNPTNTDIGGLGTNESVYDVKFNPHDANQIFIAATGYLYRSKDNFATIEVVSDNSYASIEFHQTDEKRIFAPREYYWNRNQIYHSTDGGDTWSQLHNFPDNENRRFRVATTAAEPNTIFFSSHTYLCKSMDDGATVDTIAGSEFTGSDFEVSQTDADIMINGTIDIKMSYDGGSTWSDVTDWYWAGGGTPPNDYVHADIRYATFVDDVIYCGTDGYMVQSTDNGATWSILSDGTNVRENYKLGVSQSDNNLVVSGSQDNGTSIYQGQENDWLEWIGADGMEAIIHPLDDDWMIGSIQNGNKRRSNTRGYNDEGINDHDGIGNLQWEAPLLYDPMDHRKILTIGQSLYSSDDFGTTWDSIYQFSESRFQQLAKCENDSNILLASNDSDIFRSDDNGISFAQVGQNTLPNRTIEDIAFDPTDDQNVVIVYGHHEGDIPRIYRSSDGGITWTNITYNLNDMPIRTVVIDHTSDKNIYLGAEIGIYKMSWNDTQYELWADNLPTTTTEELEIMYASNMLRAATWGRGLWERCLDGRDSYPKITKVDLSSSINETHPYSNQKVELTATLMDADDVTSMFIKYSFDDISLTNELPMVRYNKDQYITDGYMPEGNDGQKLYFRVYAVNAAGDTTETYRYMYTLRPQPTQYCSATGTNNTVSDYINQVDINGFSNSTGQDYYYLHTGELIEVNRFETYELEVGLAFSFEPDTAFAWVDWDNSLSFDDDELILFSAFDDNHKAYAQLTVPSEAISNSKVRMRVRNNWNNNNPDPCIDATGEVEDYTIRINPGCASGEIVTNLNNKNQGSLRHLLEHTCTGDTIYISENLANDTLHIYDSQIVINDDVTIIGIPLYNFTLSGNNERRIFRVRNNANLGLQNLRLVDAKHNQNGGAIFNLGNLFLRDVEFENNKEGLVPKPLTNVGTLSIMPGVSNVKE